MQTLKNISKEEMDGHPLEWFKTQYTLIQEEIKRKQRANAMYATNYYRANRHEILSKRKALQTKKKDTIEKREPRPRGRPRIYVEDASPEKD